MHLETTTSGILVALIAEALERPCPAQFFLVDARSPREPTSLRRSARQVSAVDELIYEEPGRARGRFREGIPCYWFATEISGHNKVDHYPLEVTPNVTWPN